MATMQSKLDRLESNNNESAGTFNKQLMWPADLATANLDHSGIAMVFELNKTKVSGDKTTPNRAYENKLTGEAGMITRDYYGNLNTEVAMQRDAGAKSLRDPATVGEWGGAYVKTPYTIILPPPQQIIDNLVANWNTVEMGSIGAAANMFGSIGDGDKDAFLGQVGRSVPRMVAGGVEAAGGPNIRSFIDLVSGSKANAFAEVIFGSVNNRFFPFQWTLTPRNAAEAETIRQIIHRFRYAQMPELLLGEKNGSFYKAPWTFDIHFVDIRTGKESKWWPKIGTCALTAVSVNRTPNGEFSVIRSQEDGAAEIPSSTVIDLQFTELFVLSKENMEDPDNSY